MLKHLLSIVFFIFCISPAYSQVSLKTPEIGVVQDYENDSLLYAQGYRCLVENTSKVFSPITVDHQQYNQHLKRLKSLQLNLWATNIFLPGSLKVVGPEVDEKAILEYVEEVFKRGREAGIQMIIWGSGGSRRVPEGFDKAKAREQFISIAGKIAEKAKAYNITLALENLNKTEVNFINSLEEALDIAKSVNHPNLRVCADVYHMLKEGEAPEAIEKGKGFIVYSEVAEKEGRTPPGVNGEDFKPYFRALRNIGFDGKIVIECRWDVIAAQCAQAYEYLKKQLDEAYRK